MKNIITLRMFSVLALLLLAGCNARSNSVAAQNVSTTGGSSPTQTAAQTSTNWSGYVLPGSPGQFNAVSASWTVPAVTCVNGTAVTDSANWVGVGGSSIASPALIQAGSDQGCNTGPNSGAYYYAWTEAYPAPSAQLDPGTYPVQPGDQMTVSLSSTLVLWSITIVNHTRGWTYSGTSPFVTAGDSAEWIMEAPSTNAGIETLANFGRTSFSGLTANGAGPALTGSDSIAMVDANNKVIANPSAPGSGGDSFAVCYGAGACQ